MQFRLPALLWAAAAIALAACTDATPVAAPGPRAGPALPPTNGPVVSAPVLDARGYVTGHPADTLLREADGTLAVRSPAAYAFFWSEIAPRLDAWAADARLDINPNYVAAIVTKESGFDSLAVSWMPADGLPQLTSIADADLQQMVTDSAFAWMRPEVQGWARNAVVHSSTVTRADIVAGLQDGTISSANEYLFAPVPSVRAAVFWLRLLENKWTSDAWPGGYGTFARAALDAGAPLTQSQLVDLVTVSYNQGYDWVHDLVVRYGAGWTSMLAQQGAAGVEAADYLDRVRHFTSVFQDAATAAH